ILTWALGSTPKPSADGFRHKGPGTIYWFCNSNSERVLPMERVQLLKLSASEASQLLKLSASEALSF
ncbi:hypothetical protein A2U01_0054744, partial [Trifolium medium]|nr:hypothetical protein [Trifolium medium]